MASIDKIKKKIKYNYEMADMIIKQWYENEHCLDTGCVDVGTTEKILKFIHKEELFCRQLVQSLPGIQAIEICMTIYGETTYGKYKKYHKEGFLHIHVAEAIRILLYGISFEREYLMLFPSLLFELLEHIELIAQAKELAQMIEVGILCDTENLKLAQGYFSFGERDFHIIEQYKQHYSGKGLRLRMARNTEKLLYRDLEESDVLKSNFVESIQKLLSEPVSGQDILFFKGTYYEFFPAINECDHTYKEFLEILLEKIDFLTKLEMLLLRQYCSFFPQKKYIATEMALIVGHPFIIPEKIVKECMVFIPEWKRWNVMEKNKIKLLDMPIIRNYDGRCMTSFPLCADAINAWLENSIYSGSENVRWKKKICQKIEAYFENEVTDYMRKHKFTAGRVEQNGMWHIDSKDEVKDLELLLPGEVDVLAVSHYKKIVYLIECKCIHDVLTTSGNGYQKFKNIKKNLSGKYVQKFKKKREIIKQYVDSHFLDYQLVTVILTDIDFPVYLSGDRINAWEENISICDLKTLKKSVVKNTSPESCVQHI